MRGGRRQQEGDDGERADDSERVGEESVGLGGGEPTPSHRGKRPGSPGIVRARPRTPAPLLVTHSLCYVFHPIPPLAFRLPHRAQRPLPPSVLFPPQNGVTPALKLGSPVLTTRDSWGYPPIVRFYRPLLVDVKRVKTRLTLGKLLKYVRFAAASHHSPPRAPQVFLSWSLIPHAAREVCPSRTCIS